MFLVILSFPIRQSLQEDEEGAPAQVNGPGQSAGSTVEGGLMLDLAAHEAVEEEGDADAEQKDNVELHIDGGAEAVAEPPDENDGQVERKDAERRTNMGESQVDEEVVQMGFVGTEGRLVAHNARGHHTQGVEDGNAHDGQGEGNESQPLRQTERKLVVGQQADDERGKDGADDEGAAIADEHLGGASEDVVEEEGQQGSDAEQGQ